MNYYRVDGHSVCSPQPLDLPPAAPPAGDALLHYLFARPPLSGRTAFCVNHPAQLTAPEEDIRFLDPDRLPPPPHLDPVLSRALAAGRLRAVNRLHPRWRERLGLLTLQKRRLHLLALGDVGSTLLTGLRLLGGETLSAIGICDLRAQTARRWEFEMNQISPPWEYDALPPVEIVPPEALFDCDVFVFCASKYIPPVGSAVGDVRMAQYAQNAPLVADYARQARAAGFRGLFAVVSDPVDPLCAVALAESNRGPHGEPDCGGLFPEQVRGFGLGVMNARAAYYAKRDPRFHSFLTEGRTFGPHGEDLVVANSIAGYDDALSRELTRLVVTANLQMREWGFKPYVAPALSSGALSLLPALRGGWHCSSTCLGGIFMGAKNRITPAGIEVETLPLPDPLFARIAQAANRLAALPPAASPV